MIGSFFKRSFLCLLVWFGVNGLYLWFSCPFLSSSGFLVWIFWLLLPLFTEIVYATSTAVLFQVGKRKILKVFKNKPMMWRWQHLNPIAWVPPIGSSCKGSPGARWVRCSVQHLLLFIHGVFCKYHQVNRILVDYEYGTEAAKQVNSNNSSLFFNCT